jgi:hypothetical protein
MKSTTDEFDGLELADLNALDALMDEMDVHHEFARVRFERLGCGRYAVHGEITIKGECQKRRLECWNPAYGIAKIEEEIGDLLLAQARVKAQSKKRK